MKFRFFSRFKSKLICAFVYSVIFVPPINAYAQDQCERIPGSWNGEWYFGSQSCKYKLDVTAYKNNNEVTLVIKSYDGVYTPAPWANVCTNSTYIKKGICKNGDYILFGTYPIRGSVAGNVMTIRQNDLSINGVVTKIN